MLAKYRVTVSHAGGSDPRSNLAGMMAEESRCWTCRVRAAGKGVLARCVEDSAASCRRLIQHVVLGIYFWILIVHLIMGR